MHIVQITRIFVKKQKHLERKIDVRFVLWLSFLDRYLIKEKDLVDAKLPPTLLNLIPFTQVLI